MFKRSFSRSWICSNCTQRYTLGALRSYATSNGQHDRSDARLRKVFDSPAFWQEFSRKSTSITDGHNVGLFQNRYLTVPSGFRTFTEVTLKRADAAVKRILAASSTGDYKLLVKHFDRLSDLLCRVIDLADFVRSTHPDQGMRTAATQAYGNMYQYMNVLNTTPELNNQLKAAYEIKEVTESWTEEERRVMDMLKRDFAKSAINMPQHIRTRFVTLSQEISEVGNDFVNNMAPARDYVDIPSKSLQCLDPRLVTSRSSLGLVRVPTKGGLCATALQNVPDETVRKMLYTASHTSSPESIQLLEAMLVKRAELAQLSRYESFGHLSLGDKMAKSPESVDKFLKALIGANESALKSDLVKLVEAKALHLRDEASAVKLDAWDKEFYTERLRFASRSKTRHPDFLSAYFSLGTVMQGLSRLFTRLYGIRLVPREASLGETWNADVRRIDVFSDTDGHVAVLYCDLFERGWKSPNPAHFTIRCSREIGDEEIQEFNAGITDPAAFASRLEAANDGMAVSQTTNSRGMFQLPTIALICNFSKEAHGPSLLSLSEYQTLFHEMGHAIHSIIGRTSLQNVSGTRCATDFAELPSILMEHFAVDPSVLSLFARHYQTDAPLPYELVQESLSRDRSFESLDIENQVLLSLLDQAYHSNLPLSPWFSSTTTYHHIQHQYAQRPLPPKETSWQGFFGHLFGYGATYYSYLFDRVLARRIWERVFDAGRNDMALSRDRGQRFANDVLRWGGGRDPWTCLGDVLGGHEGDSVRAGDETAMQLVGNWGLESRAPPTASRVKSKL